MLFSGSQESGYKFLESSGLKFLQIMAPQLNFRQSYTYPPILEVKLVEIINGGFFGFFKVLF
jgi:hypothetical protein